MTWEEVLIWHAYREKHGPLDLGRRTEYLMARLSAQVHNAMYTEKVEVSDFHRFQENSSIEDVAKLMRVR